MIQELSLLKVWVFTQNFKSCGDFESSSAKAMPVLDQSILENSVCVSSSVLLSGMMKNIHASVSTLAANCRPLVLGYQHRLKPTHSNSLLKQNTESYLRESRIWSEFILFYYKFLWRVKMPVTQYHIVKRRFTQHMYPISSQFSCLISALSIISMAFKNSCLSI